MREANQASEGVLIIPYEERVPRPVVLLLVGSFTSVFYNIVLTFLGVRKRNPQINSAIPAEIVGLISERAQALNLTRSKYITLIVEMWHRKGAVPVSEAEAALLGRPTPPKKTRKA